MVGEENAFEVVVFVLHHTGQHIAHFVRLLVEVAVEILDLHALGPPHRFAHVGNRKAALLKLAGRLALPRNLGIDKHHRLLRKLDAIGAQFVGEREQVHHKDALGAAHLRRGQPQPVGGPHGFDHVVDKRLHRLGVLGDGLRLAPQRVVAKHVDGQNHEANGGW